jgi:hypothetical protein
MAVTAATGDTVNNLGAAVQLGGSNAIVKFFNFNHLDGIIRSGTTIKKSSKETDLILKELVKEANQQVGTSLAKPVPVVVSFAGPVGKDGRTATPTNFEIDGKKEATNLENHLNNIQPNGVKFEVKVLNDAVSLINAAAIDNKNLLAPEDKVYQAIMGTGMGGAGGTIAKGGVTEINANEPGHAKMPDLDKFKLIEGKDRQSITSPVTEQAVGHVELYTAGGNTNDRGLMATVKNFKSIINTPGMTNNAEKLTRAVTLLNQTLKDNRVDLAINNLNVIKSPIMAKDKEFSNQEITQAAKNGDEFAQALVNFTLIRASQALAQSINSQGQDKPVALVSITGSFNKGLREAVDPNGDLQFRVIQSELKKLEHPGIKENNPKRLVQFDPELDGTPLILKERLKAGSTTNTSPSTSSQTIQEETAVDHNKTKPKEHDNGIFGVIRNKGKIGQIVMNFFTHSDNNTVSNK